MHASRDRTVAAQHRRARELLPSHRPNTASPSRYATPGAAMHRLPPVRPSVSISPRVGWRQIFRRIQRLSAIRQKAPQTVGAARRCLRQAHAPACMAASLRRRPWRQACRAPVPVAERFHGRREPGSPVKKAAGRGRPVPAGALAARREFPLRPRPSAANSLSQANIWSSSNCGLRYGAALRRAPPPPTG
jgi:hypothetical protein